MARTSGSTGEHIGRRLTRSSPAPAPTEDLARWYIGRKHLRTPPMDSSNAEKAQPKRRAAEKLDRMRERLRRSARRNRAAVQGLACVLGLLIGIILGVVVSRDAPAEYIFDAGRVGAASLP